MFMRAILIFELRTMLLLSSHPHATSESFAQPLSFWATVYKLENALKGGKQCCTHFSVLSFSYKVLAFVTLVPWYLSSAFKQMFCLYFSRVSSCFSEGEGSSAISYSFHHYKENPLWFFKNCVYLLL